MNNKMFNELLESINEEGLKGSFYTSGFPMPETKPPKGYTIDMPVGFKFEKLDIDKVYIAFEDLGYDGINECSVKAFRSYSKAHDYTVSIALKDNTDLSHSRTRIEELIIL
tara:strand:+ start:2076 stop:2408 length:333 start_codon:yes stop_codon:yes gene_type:complete